MAATAAGIRMGRAYVELGAIDAGLRRGLAAAQARLKAFAGSVQSAGTKMMAFGVGMAVPLGLAAKTYADFEQNMARTRGLLGLEKTDEAFQSLTNEAKRLGAETVFTAGQAAQAMSVFALAGMKADDILKATAPTLDLAAAGMMDMAQAADISMKVMAGMGIETDNLGYAIDVLTKAMTTANTDLVMLGDAFKYAGPVAKAAGLSFEETTAAIQLLSNAGMQADMAGTILRGAIISLTSPSEEAKKVLAELGISTKDAQGNFRTLADIIGDFQTALSGMGTGRRLEVIGTVFANRQATGIAELIDRGADELRKGEEALKSAGRERTASRIAGVQLDTLTGAWKLLTSAVEGFALVVGEALAPVLRDWGVALTAATNALSRIARQNKEWWPTLARTAAILTVTGGALWAVGAAVKVVAFGLGGVALAAGGVTAALGLMLSPVGLVAAAVGVLTASWMRNTEEGRRAFATLSAGAASTGRVVSEAFAGITSAIGAGDWTLAGQIAFKAIQRVFTGLGQWLSGQFRGWRDYFVDVWDEATTRLGMLFNTALAGLEMAWVEAVGFMSGTWATFAKFIGSTIKKTGDWAAQMLPEGTIRAAFQVMQAKVELDLGTLGGADPVADQRKALDRRRADVEARRKAVERALQERLKESKDNRQGDELLQQGIDEGALKKLDRELKALTDQADLLDAMRRGTGLGSWLWSDEAFNAAGPGRPRLPTADDVMAAGDRATGRAIVTQDASIVSNLIGGGEDKMLQAQKRQEQLLQQALDELRQQRRLMERGGLKFT